MIKINLLPHAKSAEAQRTQKQVIMFLVLCALVTAGIVVMGVWCGSKVSGLTETVQKKEEQRQAILSKVSRINQMKIKIDEVQSNIKAIRDIRLKQQLPVIYVDETVSSLPEEKIWFEALNLNSKGVIDIKGVALDNQVFAGYVDELRNSPYVRSVSTQRTSSRKVMHLNLVEFHFQIWAGPKTSGNNNETH
jgi:type IV pilus assembly protein PilN